MNEYTVAQAHDGTWWIVDPNGFEGWCPEHLHFTPRHTAERVAAQCNANPRSKPWRRFGEPEPIPEELKSWQ